MGLPAESQDKGATKPKAEHRDMELESIPRIALKKSAGPEVHTTADQTTSANDSRSADAEDGDLNLQHEDKPDRRVEIESQSTAEGCQNTTNETDSGIDHEADCGETMGDSSAKLKRKPSDNGSISAKKQKTANTSATAQKKASGSKNTDIDEMRNRLRPQDAIEARQNLGDLPEEKQIEARLKGEQMKQIKANAPKGCDKQQFNKDLNMLDNATRVIRRDKGKCAAENGLWRTKGMKTNLFHYQVCGTAWMLERERSDALPKGGLLADEMGMGKTIQTLACIMANPPSKEEKKEGRGSTLIVLPSAVHVEQWRREIITHVEKQEKPKKAKKTSQESDYEEDSDGEDKFDPTPIGVVTYKHTNILTNLPTMRNAEVVLATYHEVHKDYPSSEKLEKLKPLKVGTDEYKKEWRRCAGRLFKMKWHRVILDEAHTIKNTRSASAIACHALNAEHKWALTGTPIPNGIKELDAYLCFFGLDPRGIKKMRQSDFEQRFGRLGQGNHEDRIHLIFSKCMLQRKKADIFLGRAICPLEMAYREDKRIRMSKEERLIYKCVEDRFRQLMNQMLVESREDENRSKAIVFAFVCLTRLRQAVDHPFLLEACMKGTLTKEDIQELALQLGKISSQESFYDQFLSNSVSSAPSSQSVKSESTTFGRSGFGLTFNLDPQLQQVLNFQNEGTCRCCSEYPMKPVQLDCEHVLCVECYDSLAEEEQGRGKRTLKCPECKQTVGYIDTHRGASWTDEDSGYGTRSSRSIDTGKMFTVVSKRERERRPGNDAHGYQPRGPGSRFLALCDKNPSEPIVPSAKLIEVKNSVLEWQGTAPDDKIIVFVQFAVAAQIIGRMLQSEQIGFLYFWGEMNGKARSKALDSFRDRKDIKVLVAGLKCGNVCVNITWANRVIMVDPWWNRSVEDQAFGRIFRHGQTKKTYLRRIIVEDSIDGRMLGLQERKMEEWLTTVGRHQELTLEEQMALFGECRVDEDGQLRIEADYED